MMNMTLKISLLALLTLSLAVTVAGDRDLSELFKTAIDSIGDNLSSFFDSAKSFTQENYQKFLDGLKSLSTEDLQMAYNKVKTYYNSLSDKTSDAARYTKSAMDELAADIAANGSSSVRCSTLAASSLALLVAFLLH